MEITSPDFNPGGEIPAKFTCSGANINPTLYIQNIPKGAESLALIMDDPDAPGGTWNHWLFWNMPLDPETNIIPENSVPSGAISGTNSSGSQEYHGPCPPSGIHRYYFKLYALDIMLNLPVGAKKEELLNAMKGHIVKEAELMGKYGKS